MPVPKQDVIALVGDGDLLMGASTLWSISALAPANLLLVALADGHYSITGGQPIAPDTRFVEVAESLQNLSAGRAHSTDELASLVSTLASPRAWSKRSSTDRIWPGWSPFVDPERVRARFAARVNGGTDSC